MSAGYDHTLALKSDGTVVGWGGWPAAYPPAGLSNVVAVAGCFQHCIALKSDGTFVTWGIDQYGLSAIPGGLSNVVAIAGGYYHYVALKTDGTVVMWGGNLSANVPAGLVGVTAIAAGGGVTVAVVGGDVPPIITAQPASVTVNVNSIATFNVAAMGLAPLTYQWRKDAVDLIGATNATLTFVATNRALGGSYSVRVSKSVNDVISSNAVLRVLVPQRFETPHRLADGRLRLAFRDDAGSGLPDDLGRLKLISTGEFLGTNTVWTTNTAGFTVEGGYLIIEDFGATNAVQRFYRVLEW